MLFILSIAFFLVVVKGKRARDIPAIVHTILGYIPVKEDYKLLVETRINGILSKKLGISTPTLHQSSNSANTSATYYVHTHSN